MGLTDLERLKKTYDRLDIDYVEWQDVYKIIHLTLDCGVGKDSLYMDFKFDRDKKFLMYGIYEECT